MEFLYSVSVVVHVLSAIVWAGGVLFMGIVAVPVARRLPPDLRRRVVSGVGEAFRPVGWVALALLFLTGSFMMWRWGARWENLVDLSFFSSAHTRLIGYKLLGVVVMATFSLVHDWFLGPKASKAEPGSEEAERLRRVAGYMGRVTGVLVLVIVVLAVFIARPALVG